VKDEPIKSAAQRPTLDQRFGDQPEVIAELHALRDDVERALANGALAHEVEGMVQERMREIGRRVFAGWATDDQQTPASQPPPGAIKHEKKTPVANGLRAGRGDRANLAFEAARSDSASFFRAPPVAPSRRFVAPGARPGRFWGRRILCPRRRARA
jgi:hypothetical protein